MADLTTSKTTFTTYDVYQSPGYYLREDERHIANPKDEGGLGDLPYSMRDVLKSMVQTVRWTVDYDEEGGDATPKEKKPNLQLSFPYRINGETSWLLGISKILSIEGVTQEVDSKSRIYAPVLIDEDSREYAKEGFTVELPCIRSPDYPQFLCTVKNAGTISDEDLKQLGEMELLAEKCHTEESINELRKEIGEKIVEANRDFMVIKKMGGPEEKGLTEEEFEKFLRLRRMASAYSKQKPEVGEGEDENTVGIWPIERFIPEEEDRLFLGRILDFKTHPTLIKHQLALFGQQTKEMIAGGENIVKVAALAHNAVCYVHPRYDGNGRSARLACNFLLVSHGLWPICNSPGYYEAVTEDMKCTVRKDEMMDEDNPFGMNVINMITFICAFQFSKPCYECGTVRCTLMCGSCKYVNYCSKECQSKNWKDHKPFCNFVKGKMVAYFKENARKILQEAASTAHQHQS